VEKHLPMGFGQFFGPEWDVTWSVAFATIYLGINCCYLLISDRIFYLFSIIKKSKNKGGFTTFAS
jgi:hypothetical protein